MLYFTSDLFFGDSKISKYRGFKSSDDMNSFIIDKWNSIVNDSDNVYILGGVGDFNYLKFLKGTKVLIFSDNENQFFHTYVESISNNRDEMQDKELFESYVRNTYEIDRVIYSRRIICKLGGGTIVVLTSDIEHKRSSDFFNVSGSMGDTYKYFDDGYNVNIGINYMKPVSEDLISGLLEQNKI